MALDRLSSMAIREFGEFGGVNSSIECSTTFTGGFGAVGQASPCRTAACICLTSRFGAAAWRWRGLQSWTPPRCRTSSRARRARSKVGVPALPQLAVSGGASPSCLNKQHAALIHGCNVVGCYLYGRSFNPTVKALGR